MSLYLEEEHKVVYELIPWFVNGTLAGAEQSFVADHVSGCLVCRRAVDEEQRVRHLVLEQSSEAVGIEEGFRSLMTRVDPGPPVSRRRRAEHSPGFVNRRHRWMMAASIVLAISGFSWYAVSQSPRWTDPSFVTATEPVPHAESELFDVVFVSGLTAAERDTLLASFNADIISGPSELGRYTIAWQRDQQSSTEDWLVMLRTDERVRFVGRTFIEPESGP